VRNNEIVPSGEMAQPKLFCCFKQQEEAVDWCWAAAFTSWERINQVTQQIPFNPQGFSLLSSSGSGFFSVGCIHASHRR